MELNGMSAFSLSCCSGGWLDEEFHSEDDDHTNLDTMHP